MFMQNNENAIKYMKYCSFGAVILFVISTVAYRIMQRTDNIKPNDYSPAIESSDNEPLENMNSVNNDDHKAKEVRQTTESNKQTNENKTPKYEFVHARDKDGHQLPDYNYKSRMMKPLPEAQRRLLEGELAATEMQTIRELILEIRRLIFRNRDDMANDLFNELQLHKPLATKMLKDVIDNEETNEKVLFVLRDMLRRM
jgi:hypothetical protein